MTSPTTPPASPSRSAQLIGRLLDGLLGNQAVRQFLLVMLITAAAVLCLYLVVATPPAPPVPDLRYVDDQVPVRW
jgi:hypothetical protein